MPRLATFDGIVISMYAGDHAPPHVHAYYGEHEALIVITTGNVIEGSLPTTKMTRVQTWLEENRDDVMAKWRELEAAVR